MSETRIFIPLRGYFSLPRSAAQDTRLALETRGLLALMLSLPSDWEYTVTGLAVKAGCGRDKMRRMVRELEEVGYLVREQAHDEGGRFDGNVYVLQETPPLSATPDNGEAARKSPPPLDGFSVNGGEANSTVVGKHRQRCEPSTVQPSTGFAAEQIIEEKIIDINNTPYSPPQGDGKSPKLPKAPRRRGPREAPDWNPERFAKFWEAYPHEFRGNKQAAMDVWDRLHASDELLNEISHCLGILKRSPSWQAKIGIPHAKTFLNPKGERWKDAYDVDNAQGRPQQTRRLAPPPDDGGGEWQWIE